MKVLGILKSEIFGHYPWEMPVPPVNRVERDDVPKTKVIEKKKSNEISNKETEKSHGITFDKMLAMKMAEYTN